MSGSLNRVQLIGFLGKDPEIRTTQSGKTIASFTIATNESWKDQHGQRQERAEWHRVVVFAEGLAGIVERYLQKGSHVMIEGALQTRKWQDQAGQDRYSTEVVVNPYNGKLVMLGGPREDGSERQARGERRPTGNVGAGRPDLEDDVPF